MARLRRIALFGVLLEGVVVGLGGGITRDALLGLEPVAITTWYYIPAVLIAAPLGGAVAERVTMNRLPFVVAQAFARPDPAESAASLAGVSFQVSLDHPRVWVLMLGARGTRYRLGMAREAEASSGHAIARFADSGEDAMRNLVALPLRMFAGTLGIFEVLLRTAADAVSEGDQRVVDLERRVDSLEEQATGRREGSARRGKGVRQVQASPRSSAGPKT